MAGRAAADFTLETGAVSEAKLVGYVAVSDLKLSQVVPSSEFMHCPFPFSRDLRSGTELRNSETPERNGAPPPNFKDPLSHENVTC